VTRVWRRRRSLDIPRPAGRRWARLRRSGSRASAVIARVARRRHEPVTVTAATVGYSQRPDRSWRRRVGGLGAISVRRVGPALPVSPAVPPANLDGDPHVGSVAAPLLPGERTPARRLQFALANGCTAANLALGMTAVFLAMGGDLRLAAIVLLACVAFDGCDGGLARKFGVTSPFGAQMDSMADLGSFGVASGLVVYQWLVAAGASPFAAASACVLVAVCAAIRLARFNVSATNGRFFHGVPTTMTAAVLALNILLGPDLPVNVHVVAVSIGALAMVTSFPYAKLTSVLRLPMWLWAFPAICAMISVPGTFAAIVCAYLMSGPLLWFYLRRGGQALAA
jgi:CDP-diacylglycerol--serine O-phosphatidyltransferase